MDIVVQEKKNNKHYLPHTVSVQIFFSGRKLLLISGQKTVKEPKGVGRPESPPTPDRSFDVYLPRQRYRKVTI